MGRSYLRDTTEAAKDLILTDVTLNRVRSYVIEGATKFPSAGSQYLLDKLPIIQWLPRYHPSWLVQDFIAGWTIGVLLIPQGLAYAKIATIPIANGLYSSWIPAALYFFMGSSKDLSTGPTSMLGLLTAEIVSGLQDEYSPTAIANAVAFMVGVYSLAMGLLGLGFLLDYVSVPVLSGFISATALTIGFGQVGSLVGLDNTPGTVFLIIGDVLRRLPKWDGPTCGIGFGTLAILIALEQVGKRWRTNHYAIKYLSTSRAVIVMVVFTLISYLVNRGRSHLLWGITQVQTNGIPAPKAHDSALLAKVAAESFAPLAACCLEHLAVGKAFGRKNGYSIDQTQELNYLGLTNLVNSFFGVMPVGGAMSRTAVNSECRVRSPLSGIITAGFLVLTLYVFSPALYWLPKSTLAAIIIMAVVHLYEPVTLFYRYWRISFADFVAGQLSFWITIFVTAEMGIGIAVAWSIAYTLLRSAFVHPAVHTSATDAGSPILKSAMNTDSPISDTSGTTVPSDTVVVRFSDSIFFPNAQRSKDRILHSIRLLWDQASAHHITEARERSWSVAAQRRVLKLRKQCGIEPRETPLAVVIWDFTMVPFIDVTAVLALVELKEDIFTHVGNNVLFRLVNMTVGVRERFQRAGWILMDEAGSREVGIDVVYHSLESALLERERLGSVLEAISVEKTG